MKFVPIDDGSVRFTLKAENRNDRRILRRLRKNSGADRGLGGFWLVDVKTDHHKTPTAPETTEIELSTRLP